MIELFLFYNRLNLYLNSRANAPLLFYSRKLREKSLTEFSQLAGVEKGCWPPVSAGRKLSDLARQQLPLMPDKAATVYATRQ
jgi:hypothetical protein